MIFIGGSYVRSSVCRKNIPRTIEVDKVTGRAIYINDLKRPGMLYGKILYSTYAHAKLKA